MKLSQLRPQFIRYSSIDGQHVHTNVDGLHDATGIRFLCPKCLSEEASGVGVHSVVCWTPAVPPQVQPGPGRWITQGRVYDDLSLVGAPGKSDNVHLTGGCGAHFFVKNGGISFA